MSGGVGGRLHGPVLTAPAAANPDPHPALDRVDVVSPAVGLWRCGVVTGQIVQPGETIGELSVLGVVHRVVAGAGARGAVIRDVRPAGAQAVDAGGLLVTLDRTLAVSEIEASDVASAGPSGGLTLCAPSSGRFYGRPGPGKDPFVQPGDVIAVGHTVCLLEVMKTFHRVTYGGAGLPPQARVRAIAVADEADVNGGDVLLHLEVV